MRLALLLLTPFALAAAPGTTPPQLAGVGIDENAGKSVDLNLTFIAENGYPVALKEFFHKGRPVLLNFVYYECPMLCNLVLNGQTEALRQIPWTPGEQFEVVTISINPQETFNLAQQKRAAYLSSYGRPTNGWHFLVDDRGNVQKLARQAGFRYRYDESSKQYAHAAGIIFLTPEGRISRYLYGIKFNPRDVRLALAEASQEKFSFSPERLLLYCFHYDPASKSYVLFATNFMRAGGVAIVLIFGFVLFRYWRNERRVALRP